MTHIERDQINQIYQIIQEGFNKIVKCYESNYRDYFTNFTTDKRGKEKFEERMKTVDVMIEKWTNLITHFVNLQYKSYTYTNEIDRLDREIAVCKWKRIMTSTLAIIANHWNWLTEDCPVVNLYYIYKNR